MKKFAMLVFFISTGIGFSHSQAQDNDNWGFQAGWKIWFANWEFESGDKTSDDSILTGPVFSATKGDWIYTVSYLSTMFGEFDMDLSLDRSQNEADRRDFDISAGYYVTDNFIVFGGYKDILIDLNITPAPGIPVGRAGDLDEIHFKAWGIGLTYGFKLDNFTPYFGGAIVKGESDIKVAANRGPAAPPFAKTSGISSYLDRIFIGISYQPDSHDLTYKLEYSEQYFDYDTDFLAGTVGSWDGEFTEIFDGFAFTVSKNF